MPELPDVEIFTKNLDKTFSGARLLKIIIMRGKNIEESQATFTKALKGKKLKKIYRSGKEMRFQFEDKLIGLHLMLTGDVWVFEEKNERKTTLVEMYFDNKKALALTDRMQNAYIKLNPTDKAGPDALSKEFTLAYLRKAMERKKKIKSLLIDQDIIRGIGNSYSDEILWASRISPYSIAAAIPLNKVKILYSNIKKILLQEIKNINRYYPGKINGEVKEFLKIHTTKKTKSPTGAKIIIDQKRMMKTYYTKEQVIYK